MGKGIDGDVQLAAMLVQRLAVVLAAVVALNGIGGNSNTANSALGGSKNTAGIFVAILALGLVAAGVLALLGKLNAKVAGLVTAAIGLVILILGIVQFPSASSAVSSNGAAAGYTATIGAGVWLTLLSGLIAIAVGAATGLGTISHTLTALESLRAPIIAGAANNQLADASLAELAALAETAGSTVLTGVIQRRQKPDPATWMGSGKAAELRDIVAAEGADTVIADDELAPSQRRALGEHRAGLAESALERTRRRAQPGQRPLQGKP